MYSYKCKMSVLDMEIVVLLNTMMQMERTERCPLNGTLMWNGRLLSQEQITSLTVLQLASTTTSH